MKVYYDTGSTLVLGTALSVARDPDHRVLVEVRLRTGTIHPLAQWVYPITSRRNAAPSYHTGHDWAALVPNPGDKVTL